MTGQPCWMIIQRIFFFRDLHENIMKFPEEKKFFEGFA